MNTGVTGHKYAIQCVTDAPHWGGLSGCTFEEAQSWGKIAKDASMVTCHSDSTIAMPILVSALLETANWCRIANILVFKWAASWEFRREQPAHPDVPGGCVRKPVFSGNPAAVCPLERWLPDEQMQSIATENNLSETAFFVPNGDGYHLRWFTPKVEVDLCGHATLASAFVILPSWRRRDKACASRPRAARST